MRTVIFLIFAALFAASPARSAEPSSCSDAYRVCVKPDFGHCDVGCASTCKLRLDGCLKTGSFATPRGLMRNLKRR